MRRARLHHVGLMLLAFAVTSCASGFELGPDEVILKRDQLRALEAEARRTDALTQRVSSLEAERDTLSQRLRAVEERTGLVPFSTGELKRRRGRISFPDALYVEHRDARAKRRSLRSVLKESRAGVIVTYWATWCVPCISDEELALVKTLRQKVGAYGYELVSMAIDGLDKVQGHHKARSWVYPFWQRDRGHYDMLPQDFITEVGVNLPLFLIVTKEGDLRYYRAQKLTPDAVEQIVTAVALMGG